MYCKQCGKEIDSNSKYCSYCGTKQSDIFSYTEIHKSTSNPNPVTQNLNVSLSFGKPSETKNTQKTVEIEKYDKSYEGDHQSALFGIIIMIISLMIYLILQIDNETHLATYRAYGAVIMIIYRIVIIISVVNIAKRQNRSPEKWGILAFFIPNLALIIIGFSRKLLMTPTSITSSDSKDNISKEESLDNYDYNNITYKIKESEKAKTFWRGEHTIFTIEFSDGKQGNILSYPNDEFFILSTPGDIQIYYNSKEAAIAGLHYYLTTNKVSKKDRIN